MTQVQGDQYEGLASKFDDSRFVNASTISGMGEVVMEIEEAISLAKGFKFENGQSLKIDTLCLRFTKTPKVLRLNKTNLRTCMKILGNKCGEWKGRKIKIYYDPTVKFAGKDVGGVKVKEEVLP